LLRAAYSSLIVNDVTYLGYLRVAHGLAGKFDQQLGPMIDGGGWLIFEEIIAFTIIKLAVVSLSGGF
jgi:hypothetical protein